MNSKNLSNDAREKLSNFFSKGIIAEHAKKENQKKAMTDQLKKATGGFNIVITKQK